MQVRVLFVDLFRNGRFFLSLHAVSSQATEAQGGCPIRWAAHLNTNPEGAGSSPVCGSNKVP